MSATRQVVGLVLMAVALLTLVGLPVVLVLGVELWLYAVVAGALVLFLVGVAVLPDAEPRRK